MTKRFKLKIIGDINDVDSEIILKDGGQPLAEFISIEDARLVRDLLNELNDEKQQLLSANTKLTEENTNILSTIRQAYQTERTNIGRMVLKQLMEQFE